MSPIEFAAFDAIGPRPGVLMSYRGNEPVLPHVAVAVDALDAIKAGGIEGEPIGLAAALGAELAIDLDKGFPAWRGWAITYPLDRIPT